MLRRSRAWSPRQSIPAGGRPRRGATSTSRASTRRRCLTASERSFGTSSRTSPARGERRLTPVRVLVVNAQGADLAGGGSGRYVADLARGLTARGHDVHVLAAF